MLFLDIVPLIMAIAYRTLGYKFTDDKIEKQDDFLNRMSGLMRLFATICLTQLPPAGHFGGTGAGQPEAETHPFGLPAAWSWLVSHLQIEPAPDITATPMYEVNQEIRGTIRQISITN
jgi:nucleoporin GLE1